MELSGLRQQLIERYGETEADSIMLKIMPGIISHFVKMLSKAVDGQMVSEDYCIDESHAVIHMEGTKGKISAAYLRQ